MWHKAESLHIHKQLALLPSRDVIECVGDSMSPGLLVNINADSATEDDKMFEMSGYFKFRSRPIPQYLKLTCVAKAGFEPLPCSNHFVQCRA